MLPLRIQLWSWNYAPEPTAMGPIAALWAETMRERGHEVEVIAAHPHYPPAVFPQRLLPYREQRNGIRVTRLPLWIGHASALQRAREEATYAVSAAAAAALLPRADVDVVVSPSFVALAPLILRSRFRRLPWVLWLQDILPDAAVTTGFVRGGVFLGAAARLERAAYGSADRIVVISDSFRRNLLAKGTRPEKVEVIYNPATRGVRGSPTVSRDGPLRILAMGNIGYSQGLPELVRALEASDLRDDEVRLVITGSGELADDLRSEIRTNRVEYLGLVSDARLDAELDRAALGLVSQRPDVAEFNLPSKLMTFVGRGVPVLAFVRQDAEVARIVFESEAGWVVPERTPAAVAGAVRAATFDEREQRAHAALALARDKFSLERMGRSFEDLLLDATRLRAAA